MSGAITENKDQAVDFAMKTVADLKKMGELKEKRNAIEENRINSQYSKILEAERQEELFKNADMSGLSDDIIDQLKKETEEYLDAAKNSSVFLNLNVFKGAIPFFRKNIIFIGAPTGEGKSTITANIALNVFKENKRVLILTNEEAIPDCYNRITALHKGWNYQAHDEFTAEQKESFLEYMDVWPKNIVIYGDKSFNKIDGGDTTSFEGITNILTRVAAQGVKYDVILIDYYQNISHSKKDPTSEAWRVQERFCSFLDQFKNNYPAPIVVLGQLRPKGKEGSEADFEERIKGRKTIHVIATCSMEMAALKKELATIWTIHKSRFGKHLGKDVKTGWDRGSYVEYTEDFRKKVEEWKMNRVLEK